jgi:hypothetical protein
MVMKILLMQEMISLELRFSVHEFKVCRGSGGWVIKEWRVRGIGRKEKY